MKLPAKEKVLKELRSWLIFAALTAVVFISVRSVQSHLGQQAFAETGLEALSLNEALELAKDQNKQVVANLSAYWCGACRALDKNVLANDMVKSVLNEKYIFARIDSESDEAGTFMQRYGARGYPTLLVLDADGNKLKHLPNTTSPHKFISFL